MNNGLSVIVPIPIDDTVLMSSTVPEPTTSGSNVDPDLYDAGTSYALNVLVRRPNHRRYRSRVEANLGNTPEDSPLQWRDIGAVNKYAMFDGAVSTQTVVDSPLTVVLQPGFCNAMYLAGLDGDAISVTIKDAPGGTVIYSHSQSLEGSMPGDWYEYWFGGFKPLTELYLDGWEPYLAAEMTITITSGGPVKCGLLVVGDNRPLGSTEYGAKATPVDNSYIKTNDFGETEIVKRYAAKSMTLSAFLEQAEADTALQQVTELLGVPCVWIGTVLPGYGGLRVYGLGSGEVSYDGPTHAKLSINVKGLI